MSKRIRTILIGAIVIVALAGLTALLLLWPKEEEAGPISTPSSPSTITIANMKSDELQAAEIRNEKDEYIVELVGERMWRIKDIQDFPANEGQYVTLRNNLTTISAMEIIEEDSQNLENYGLASPAEEVKTTFQDGSSYHIALGDFSPDGSRRYALWLDESSTRVYGLSSTALRSISLSRYDYLDTSIVPAFTAADGSGAKPILNSLTFTGSYLDAPIVVEEMAENDPDLTSTMDTIKLTSPVNALIDLQWLEEKVFPVFGLTASRVVKANPSEEDLTAYGLATPYMTMEVRYETTSSFKLSIGNSLDADGNTAKSEKDIVSYYVMREGSDLVYAVPKESMLWLGVQPKDLISSLITLPNIATVDKVNFTLDGQAHSLVITQTPSSDPEKADDPNQNEYSFQLDGKPVSDEMSRKFYQVLLGTSIQDVNTTPPTGSPVLTIEYHQNTGRIEKVDFYVLEDLTTIVALNGNPSYIGRSGMVDKVRKELIHLQNGETVETDW